MMVTDYPAKTCELDRLVTQPKLIAKAINGDKTEQRRNGLYGYPGERFSLDGIHFEIITVRRQALGDMTDADARAEGFNNLSDYQQLILRMHQFRRVNPPAGNQL